MKTLKNLLFLTIFSVISIANLNAVIGDRKGSQPPCPLSSVINFGSPVRNVNYDWNQEPERWDEIKRIEALKAKRAEEARTMKPLTKISGNVLLNKLLVTESDTAKAAELSRVPFEVKEYLFELIDNKKDLLNENNPDDKNKIDRLDFLQFFIINNLGESLPLPTTLEQFPELMNID